MEEIPVTIVIPVFNREKIVINTLDSVYAQTVRPLRVIVVDNNSTDRTVEVIRGWADKHNDSSFTTEIIHESEKGASAARNRGLDRVDSPFVMFFDSDDIMSLDHIEKAIDTLRRNPDADIIGWNAMLHMIDGKRKILPFTTRDILFRQIFDSILSTQRYMVRKSFLLKAGSWNERVPIWNDYELGIRLLLCSPKIAVMKAARPTVTVMCHPESITGTDFLSKEKKLNDVLQLIGNEIELSGKNDYLKWVQLRKAVLAALIYREDRNIVRKNFSDLIAATESFYRKVLLRIAFNYTALGGRGIHRIFRLSGIY